MTARARTVDLDLLTTLERRIGWPPHDLLWIPRSASVAQTCDAYAQLCHACEPSRYAADPATAARARRVLRHLRLAFRAAIRRDLPPIPAGPLRAASRAGYVT